MSLLVFGRMKMKESNTFEHDKVLKKGKVNGKWSLNKDAVYIGILLAASLIFYWHMISATRIIDSIHYIANLAFNTFSRVESLTKYGAMPSWSQYFYGGHPLFAIPEEPMFDLVLFFAL